MRLTKDSAQELAARIVRAGDVEDFRARITPVTEAILMRRSPHHVEKLADRAAAAAWHEGLSAAAEEALDRLREQAARTLDQVEGARVESVRPVTDNRLARMLVVALGLRTAYETREVRELVESAEEELQDAPPADQRRIALRWAGVVLALRGDIPELELMGATARVNAGLPHDAGERLEVAEPAARALACLVATEERRAAVRKAAGELARFACGGLPTLKRALDDLLGEEVPDEADEDDLWVGTVLGACAGPRRPPASYTTLTK